ncbi:MAG: hypothetical protein RIR65_2757, partial [Planctomycetota bacterium]
MIAPLALLACVLQDPALEGRYYAVDHLKLPDEAVLEVGGMGLMPDGDLMVSTRRGQVWRIEGALAEDPADAKASLYAEGLWEGLGLAVVDGRVFVLQRTELSEL